MVKPKAKYTWERLGGDCAGGFIAALIALPYGLAMAQLMGLPPILGVFTSIATTPITALLGRNALLIGGTSSVTVPFIAGAVHAQGIGGAAKVSIVASAFLMSFCVLRLGRFVSLVPATVVSGFAAGIGGLMVVSQLHVLFGVHAPPAAVPALQLAYVVRELPAMRWLPFALGGAVILGSLLTARISQRLPAPLAGVSVAALVAWLLRAHEPEIGSLHLALPPFAGFSWMPYDVVNLIPSGFMLAFVSAVNLLLTSRTIEHFQGRREPLSHDDSDAEVGVFGIANLVAGIFGAPMSVGIPARSVAAIRCGATTRLSNLFHALFLILMVCVGSGILAHIPLAALAGVTIYMGILLLNTGAWRRLGKMHIMDSAAFLITVAGVLATNAVAAVLAGCSLYAANFAYRKYLVQHPQPASLPDVAA